MRQMALLLIIVIMSTVLPAKALARDELTPSQRRAVNQAGFGMQRAAQFDDPGGGPGTYLALGDRFGRLSVLALGDARNRGRIWASRTLDGDVVEVTVADLDNDQTLDHLVCRTTRRIYAFDLRDQFREVFESLLDTFRSITAFTVANVDSDRQQEIVVCADGQIHYLDGSSFMREWTSMDRYPVARIRAGDVDDDRRVELVLDTGQVLDAGNGRVEWTAPDPFGSQFELLDLDGDGVPEILGESPGRPLRIWSGSSQRELRTP